MHEKRGSDKDERERGKKKGREREERLVAW